MLVLTRRPGERVVVDLREHGLGLIQIHSSGGWRMAIDALPEVKVLRGELFDRQEAEKARGQK